MSENAIPWDTLCARSAARGFIARQLFLIRSVPVAGMGPIEANMQGHLAFQLDLEARGIMFAAGPIGDPQAHVWHGEGMIIIRAADLQEATRIASSDPMHVNGARTFSVHPWLMNEGSLTFRVAYSSQRFELS